MANILARHWIECKVHQEVHRHQLSNGKSFVVASELVSYFFFGKVVSATSREIKVTSDSISPEVCKQMAKAITKVDIASLMDILNSEERQT